MSEEIKVIITLKGGKGSIGLQSPDCDPVLTTFEGDLEHALGVLPGLLQEANLRWDENPRYPKCDLPEPSQTATVSRPTTQRQPASSQGSMF